MGNPSFSTVSLKTGTNAAASAPSPNNRRKRLGILNARRNVAVAVSDPSEVMAMSRTIPNTREMSVRAAIILAAPKKCSRSECFCSFSSNYQTHPNIFAADASISEAKTARTMPSGSLCVK